METASYVYDLLDEIKRDIVRVITRSKEDCSDIKTKVEEKIKLEFSYKFRQYEEIYSLVKDYNAKIQRLSKLTWDKHR